MQTNKKNKNKSSLCRREVPPFISWQSRLLALTSWHEAAGVFLTKILIVLHTSESITHYIYNNNK